MRTKLIASARSSDFLIAILFIALARVIRHDKKSYVCQKACILFHVISFALLLFLTFCFGKFRESQEEFLCVGYPLVIDS
jgi:hypothetical protein